MSRKFLFSEFNDVFGSMLAIVHLLAIVQALLLLCCRLHMTIWRQSEVTVPSCPRVVSPSDSLILMTHCNYTGSFRYMSHCLIAVKVYGCHEACADHLVGERNRLARPWTCCMIPWKRQKSRPETK